MSVWPLVFNILHLRHKEYLKFKLELFTLSYPEREFLWTKILVEKISYFYSHKVGRGLQTDGALGSKYISVGQKD